MPESVQEHLNLQLCKTGSQCPRIPETFLMEEEESLPPFIYRQEYECSFEETEDQVFTTDMIDRAVTDEVSPLFGAVG
jgi:hypothetical protein